jgi:hypothetical protein
MPALLDLPAPLLSWLDAVLETTGLPPVLRIVLYAILSAWLSMTIYRRCSRQEELATLSASSRALRQELAAYDGPFEGLMQRVRRLMRLSARHLRLSLVPALLGGLPLLLLMPWLSNQFGLAPLPAGTLVLVVPEGLQQPRSSLQWTDPAARWDEQARGWRVPWPAQDQPVELRQADRVLLRLPPAVPAAIVHRRMPAFNLLVGNPAGYLPDDAPLAALRFDLRERELHWFGPAWLRGWLATYLVSVFAFSLALKWRWKLQ